MARTVGIVAKPRLEAVEVAVELQSWLEGRGHTVLLDETTAESARMHGGAGPEVLRTADLVVVLGGDGTLIHAARLLAGAKVPIFGVNLGYLGFLTEIGAESDWKSLLERAIEGELPTEDRMMLEVELRRGGATIAEGLVLNDAVVSKAALARIAELECLVNGREIADYRVDGLIVATPTGSTAYNLSAGGPIVDPHLDAILISPICPHTLSQRPIVLPGDAEIDLVLASAGGEMVLTLDGQEGLAMEAGDEVVVRRSDKRTWLFRGADLDFFAILREKLGWG